MTESPVSQTNRVTTWFLNRRYCLLSFQTVYSIIFYPFRRFIPLSFNLPETVFKWFHKKLAVTPISICRRNSLSSGKRCLPRLLNASTQS